MNRHKDSKLIWIVHPVCLASVLIIDYRLKSSVLSDPAGLLTSVRINPMNRNFFIPLVFTLPPTHSILSPATRKETHRPFPWAYL